MAERIEGLLPAGDLKAPKVLILGSMPSAQSLQKAQYYGNPRNHFWPIVCRTFEEELPEEYEARIALAARQHIALWDSVQSCVRPGSLDQNIKEERPNDVPAFLSAYPTVEKVLFNGTAARRLFEKYHKPQPGVRYVLLPSTSPIPQRTVRTFEEKLALWRAALLENE